MDCKCSAVFHDTRRVSNHRFTGLRTDHPLWKLAPSFRRLSADGHEERLAFEIIYQDSEKMQEFIRKFDGKSR